MTYNKGLIRRLVSGCTEKNRLYFQPFQVLLTSPSRSKTFLVHVPVQIFCQKNDRKNTIKGNVKYSKLLYSFQVEGYYYLRFTVFSSFYFNQK